MRKSYIREKRTLCGDTYQAVGIYPVTDQEHRQRGKKRKESDRGQKSRNKAASLRRRQRKVLANFDQNGFYLTATYEDAYLPEDEEGCWRDVKNYARRVQRAVRKRFGVRGTWLKLMLWAVRNGEAGRLHMHGFAQCPGLSEAERRELRYMLEDRSATCALWRPARQRSGRAPAAPRALRCLAPWCWVPTPTPPPSWRAAACSTS